MHCDTVQRYVSYVSKDTHRSVFYDSDSITVIFQSTIVSTMSDPAVLYCTFFFKSANYKLTLIIKCNEKAK